MNGSRKAKLDKHYKPLPTNEGDEIFPNGIFRINITKIMEHIETGVLKPARGEGDKKTVVIHVPEWFETHLRGDVKESHLLTIDVTKPVIQAEIRSGMFEIIDGNHRMEKAYRESIPTMESYKLNGEQLIPYFIDVKGYQAFVEYWNSKLE